MKISMRFICIIISLYIFFGPWAHAEIEKIAVPVEKGLLFRWWPKLSPVEGWHQDQEYSNHYNINALSPDGFTFKDAETVIYAKAIYKPRKPKITSLALLIENDKKGFLEKFPGIKIQEVPPLVTADGRKLHSFVFFPGKTGNWERVSYGEEGGFYLIFTLSSRTQAGYSKAVASYEKLIADYK